jgi:hypothetical protein
MSTGKIYNPATSTWIKVDAGNADTIDGKYANNTANNLVVLDSSAKVPIANIPTGTTSTTVSIGNHAHNTYLPLGGGNVSGEINMQDNLMTRPKLKDYSESLGTTPATTGAVNFDLTTGNTFNLTPTGACTIGILNPPASGNVGSFTLQINMPSTLYVMTFPTSFYWDNDAVPTFTASKTAIITGFTLDGGIKYRVGTMGTNFTT